MKVFLAGTIDDGHSTDWQREVVEALKNTGVEIFNPRRYDFPEHPKPEDVIRQIQWEHREEEYREKLYIGNDGNVKMYHTEYSWKPSKFLLNVRLLVDKAMQVYVGILENRLVKFDADNYY